MVGKTVASAAGASVSVMMMFWVCVDVFPLPSSYVHVITVVPNAETILSLAVVPVIVPVQASVAVGIASFRLKCR
jgi:hypothetical protein